MDDSAEFDLQKRAFAAEMGQDADLRNMAREVVTRADRYNFSYQWSWLGLPIIQMPMDIVAIQEVVWETRPTVIIETGIARGGSLIFLASLLQMIGEGQVLGIDIDIRPHNRTRIEEHPLSERISLIEGSSTSPEVMAAVSSVVSPQDRVMVILDSDHTHAHVLDELRLYAPLVTAGQYLIVSDTVVEDIPEQAHRPRPWGPGNNPKTALSEYLRECDRFEVDAFLDAKLLETSSPGGFLRCIR